MPVVQIRATKANSAYVTVQNHIMNFSNNQIYKSHVTSLSNLERLGLLNINYSSHSADEREYDFVKDHPAFHAATEKLLEIQKIDPDFIKVNIQKGKHFMLFFLESWSSVAESEALHSELRGVTQIQVIYQPKVRTKYITGLERG